MPSERNGKRLILKIPIGAKTLLIRRGNYSRRRLIPFIEHGPFGCWLASWRFGQISLELTRWL